MRDVDEDCVNRELDIGKDLGIFFPGFNDCKGFVAGVLSRCSTKEQLDICYDYYEGF